MNRIASRPLVKAAILGAAALAAGGAALAHTGHGHEDFTAFSGLVHALREPDHLAALALGIVITGALAPWVLRGARRIAAALRRALEMRRNPPARAAD